MIGIIAAMDQEIQEIVNLMETHTRNMLYEITFYEGLLANKPVVIMKSGVGKGNAAMSAAILLQQYEITSILNIGTAGGLLKEQQILDIVLSERVVQHDFDTSAIDGAEGVGLYFSADAALISACESALASMHIRWHKGLVASGDQFVSQQEQLARLQKTFPLAICAEMEAGAIAQVCAHFKIPFVVLRGLSDVAPHPNSHMDFMEYVTHASKQSAKLCETVMRIV